MLKLGAVRTRRLAVSEGADRPSGSAYGNPRRGTRECAPSFPSERPWSRGPTSSTRAGGASTGWRRTGPSSTTGGSSTTRPARSWPSPSCGRPRRRAPRRRCAKPSSGSPATQARRSRGGSPPSRPRGRAPRRSPGRGQHGGGGGEPSRGKAAAHDAPHREPRRPAVDPDRLPAVGHRRRVAAGRPARPRPRRPNGGAAPTPCTSAPRMTPPSRPSWRAPKTSTRITVAFSAGRHLHSPLRRGRRAQSSPYSVRTPS